MTTPERSDRQASVSVIVRTFNRKGYVVEAIDCALSQTYPLCETIVIDVASTDGTGELLKTQFGDRIRYSYLEDPNHFKAVNYGIRLAQGKYIFFLDDDDWVAKDLVEHEIRAFKEHPEVSVVFPSVRWFRGKNPEAFIKEMVFRAGDDLLKTLLHYSCVPFSGTMVTKDCLEKIGGVDENLISCIDWDLWLRLAYSGFAFFPLSNEFIYSRVHDSNIQWQKVRMARGCIRLLEKAEKYITSEQVKREGGLQKSLARRHLMLGKSLLENKEYQQGRKEILKSIYLKGDAFKGALFYFLLSFFLQKKSIDRLYDMLWRLIGRSPNRWIYD